jgi:hypothetical protein
MQDRFAAPAASGWADVVVHFAFDADDNRHVVEVRLVHQDLALVAEEHSAAGPHLKTRSALELLAAKGLLHLVPPPRPPQVDPSRSPTRTASSSRLNSGGGPSSMHGGAAQIGAAAAGPPLPGSAEDRLSRLESAVRQLELTVEAQATLIAAQAQMIEQLSALRGGAA